MNNKTIYVGLGVLALTGLGLGLYFWKKNEAITEKDFDDLVSKCKSIGCDIFDVPSDKNQAILFKTKLAEKKLNYPKNITKAEHNEIMSLMKKPLTISENARVGVLLSKALGLNITKKTTK